LVELEEERFIAGFHQQVQKEREKAYHEKHIKKKAFKQGDLVLVYDNKFIKNPGKFRTHWMGPYEVVYVTEGGHCAVEDFEWRMEGRFGE
jgi:predicted SnoaL-like aldol condensation-catalyzing enzyme